MTSARWIPLLLLASACARDPRPPTQSGAAPAAFPPRQPAYAQPGYPDPAYVPPPAPPTPPPTAAAAPAPLPPSIDRTADRDARIREAKSLLGPSTQIELVADVFVLVGEPGYAGYKAAHELARKAAEAYFNERITTRPPRSIPVYVFGTTKSYEAFCVAHDGARCISPLGFYDSRRVMVNAQNGLGSLTHEMMHPLIETDFPGAPEWFDEGVASLFGKAVFPKPGEVHGATNWRLPELKKALGSSRAESAGMDRLFGMSPERFRDGEQGLHYAMARYLCQWLDERNLLWPFYHRWRDQVSADPTGVRSFTEATGQSPSDANPTWVKWVKAL